MTSPKHKSSTLESTIMNKIYRHERRRTVLTILEYVLLIGTLLILAATTTITLYSMLAQREIFALFELFTQDPETINRYLFDTLQTIYIETPKEYVLSTLILVMCTIIILILFGKRLPTLWHKLQSIRKFSNRYH